MTLKEIILMRGTIRVVTGLHIGAGNESIEIGGLDLPVIKNPRTLQPYIPGSSLKGKMRFLTEWATPGALHSDGNVHSCTDTDCVICRVFGPGKSQDANNAAGRGPTRLIVRDAALRLPEGQEYDPELFLEVKHENTIDRMTGTAKNPRPLERVVPDTRFAFEIAFRVLDEADYAGFAAVVEAMGRLEADTLGGSGSRGSGKIAFENMTVGSIKGKRENIASTDKLVDYVKEAF